jgi:hypothetical protein
VHHPSPMNGGQGGGHADRQPLQVTDRQPTAGSDRPVKPHSLHILGHQVGQRTRDVSVEHPGGTEPNHAAGGADLMTEHPQERGVARQLRAEDLDRHPRPVAGAAKKHRARPTGTKPPQDPVGPNPLGITRSQPRQPARPARVGSLAALGQPSSLPSGARPPDRRRQPADQRNLPLQTVESA